MALCTKTSHAGWDYDCLDYNALMASMDTHYINTKATCTDILIAIRPRITPRKIPTHIHNNTLIILILLGTFAKEYANIDMNAIYLRNIFSWWIWRSLALRPPFYGTWNYCVFFPPTACLQNHHLVRRLRLHLLSLTRRRLFRGLS